jgi:hypothetical protein
MAERKFGSGTFRCDKLDAEAGMRLLIRTTKIFGAASGLMAALSEADKAKAEAMSLAALAEFVGKLDEDEAVAFVKDVIGICRCDGAPAIFGVTPGDLSEAFQVTYWALEVQFKDFLGGPAGRPLMRKPLAA